MNYSEYSDLELIDHFIDQGGLCYPDPRIFNYILSRNLLYLVNTGLGNDKDEAKAIVRARLANEGKYIGDPEIEKIQFIVERIEKIKEELSYIPSSEPKQIIELSEALIHLSQKLLDFYKNDNKICLQ